MEKAAESPTRRRAALRAWGLAALLSLCALPPALSQPAVQITQRLLPERAYTTDMVTEMVTTLRILEDRGLGARAAARGVRFPITLDMVDRQSVDLQAGAADPAGAYDLRVTYLSKTSHMRSEDGREQLVPDPMPITGVVMHSRMTAEGDVVPGSVRLEKAPPELARLLVPMLDTVFRQLAGAGRDLSVAPGQPAVQRLKFQMPVAGLATVDVAMTITYTLAGIEGDMARIALLHTMELAAAPAMPSVPARIRLTGSGGGSMAYDMRRQLVVSNASNTMMQMEMDTPEALMGATIVSRQSTTTGAAKP